jgi:hypothetical protein
MLDDCPNDQVDIGDSPAAGGDGDALTRLNSFVQVKARQLLLGFGRHVGNPRSIKNLPHAKNLGEGRHGGQGSKDVSLSLILTRQEHNGELCRMVRSRVDRESGFFIAPACRR